MIIDESDDDSIVDEDSDRFITLWIYEHSVQNSVQIAQTLNTETEQRSRETLFSSVYTHK